MNVTPEGASNASARIAVEDAKDVEPPMAPVTRTPMSELEWAAVWLAMGVLAMIFLISLLLLFSVHKGEFQESAPEVQAIQKLLELATNQYLATSSPEALERANHLLRSLNEARQSARKVWFDFGQMLLLNLLLPVLTAVLGYVFGTMRTRSPNSDR